MWVGNTGEKQILLAGGVLVVLGTTNAWLNNQKLTPVLEGSIVFVLLASLLAAVSENLGKVMGALSMLVVVSALYVELPPILQKLGVHP